MWLKTLENGNYFKENYVCHLDIPNDDDDIVALLTETRILLIRSRRLKVGWDVPFSDLASINLEKHGIGLVLRGNVTGPFLPLPDQSARLWLFRNIERECPARALELCLSSIDSPSLSNVRLSSRSSG
jgi:vacuolar protein sorting-associated protein 13A/C